MREFAEPHVARSGVLTEPRKGQLLGKQYRARMPGGTASSICLKKAEGNECPRLPSCVLTSYNI
jgi:hypothetical protein